MSNVVRYGRTEVDHGPFVRKIAENTADHTASLVYADFLEENGMPELAAFIRQSIAIQQDHTAYNRGEKSNTLDVRYGPASTDAIPQQPATVFAYDGIGRYRTAVRGRPKPKPTVEVSVKTPHPDDPQRALIYGIDLSPERSHEWMKRLISEGHPAGNPEGSSALRRAVADATQTPPSEPTNLTRRTFTVARYSATPRSLIGLFRRARDNPYDNTGHAVIADALDEAYPGNKVSGLIRRQFGFGEHGGEGQRDNLWYEPVENSWDGSFPYAAHIGTDGPFNLYLRHEGGPEQAQRWVVHAVAKMNRNPELDDFGYTFEFPHEEAHEIPRLFPAAGAHIDPTPNMGWGPHDEESWIGRENEAGRFNDRMDEEERNRP